MPEQTISVAPGAERLPDAFTKVNANFRELYNETASLAASAAGVPAIVAAALRARSADVRDFGAVADGTTDNTVAINLAMSTLAAAGGGVVQLPWGSAAGWLVNGRLDMPAGVTLLGEGALRPALLMSAAEGVRFAAEDAGLIGVRIVGTHSTSSYQIRVQAAAARTAIDVVIENGNSGIQCDAPDCTIDAVMHEMRGTGIRLNGATCTGTTVYFDGRNLASFGIFITLGSTRNRILRARKIAVAALFTAWQSANRPEAADGQMGIETIGVTFDSPEQVIGTVECVRTGDAGVSISSDRNTMQSISAIDCKLNGLSVIGSNNMIGSVFALRCLTGVGFTPNAGGISKRNVIGTVISIDATLYGVQSNDASNYSVWASEGATSGQYCVVGLRVYRSNVAVSTFGTITPVHTTGSASDGVNTWNYITAAATTLDADENSVGVLYASGSGSADLRSEGAGALEVGRPQPGLFGISVAGGTAPNTTGVKAGTNRGANAVDLQRVRSFASEVASGLESVVAGGNRNRASGSRSGALSGFSNDAAGGNSCVVGGEGNTAGSTFSWVPGGRYASTFNRYGLGAWASGRFDARNGSAQSVEALFRAATTDTAAERLTADQGSPTSANTLGLQVNGAASGVMTIQASWLSGASGAAGDQATWVINTSISRAATFGSTAVQGGGASISPTLSKGTGSGWRLAITADTGTGGFNVTGTGSASMVVEWTARFSGVERAA